MSVANQSSPSPLTEETVRRLENGGLRMTPQRRRIIEILTSSSCTTPKELWYEVREQIPDLGIATVYRLLNRLEQLGVLNKNRQIGISSVQPVLGRVTDAHGKDMQLPEDGVSLEDLVRLGLVARGVIGSMSRIRLVLNGDKVDVVVNR